MRSSFIARTALGALTFAIVCVATFRGFASETQTNDPVTVAPQPVRPEFQSDWFSAGYGVLSPVFGIHTFGKWRLQYVDTDQILESGDLDGGPTMGVRLGGYKALRGGRFQIGGTMSFNHGLDGGWTRTRGNGVEESTTLRQFSFAVSFKGGTTIRPCFWLGGGLDFGPLVHVTRSWEGETYTEMAVTSDADIGVHFFPHVAADIMFVNTGTTKLGLSISAGVLLVPGIADIESSLSNREEVQHYLTPLVSLGLMLGS